MVKTGVLTRKNFARSTRYARQLFLARLRCFFTYNKCYYTFAEASIAVCNYFYPFGMVKIT